jgi:polysaccharide biosynthesis/export protein VpsN
MFAGKSTVRFASQPVVVRSVMLIVSGCLVWVLAGVLLIGSASGQDSKGMSSYRLGAGDVISIRVFGEDDFTREKIRLTDAGSVSFPVLGEIAVLGRTVGEIEKLITDRLKGRILVNPRVTVWVEEYRPFFVNGMVERPGAYPFQPGLNVRKAVSIAGGFKERASLSKIFVVRENDSGKSPFKVDVNAEIGPGDTITVEESFF